MQMHAAPCAVLYSTRPCNTCSARPAQHLGRKLSLKTDTTSDSRKQVLRVVHATAAFQQQSIPGRGVGLIAARDIEAGSVLLREPALIAFTTFTTQAAEEGFALQDAVRRLSKPQQAAYYGLANSFGDRYPRQCGIYRTNSFGGGTPGNGGVRHSIFPTVSRVNHSCLPTCIVDFDAGEAILRAGTHIPSGQELTVCYLKGFTTSWRQQRQEALRRGFDFLCQCEACGASPRAVAASDAKRLRLKVLNGHVRAALLSDNFSAALQGIEERLQLLREEGIVDPRLFTGCHWDAFRICLAAPEVGSASAWSAQFLEHAAVALGGDSGGMRLLAECVARTSATPRTAAASALRAALAAGNKAAADAAREELWGDSGGLLVEDVAS